MIENENKNEPVLDDNKNSEIIKGDLNLEKLVGKIIKYNIPSESKYSFPLNMRRIEL